MPVAREQASRGHADRGRHCQRHRRYLGYAWAQLVQRLGRLPGNEQLARTLEHRDTTRAVVLDARERRGVRDTLTRWMRETDNAGIPAGIPQLAVRLSEEEAL